MPPAERRLRCAECDHPDRTFRLFTTRPIFSWYRNITVECANCGSRANVGLDHQETTREMEER